jgi:hypothetical protein
MMENEMLDERIVEWRNHFRRHQAVNDVDIDELEDHLRSQVDALTRAGLDADEAFLVAVKRLGNLDSVSREFASEYTGRLWKQLVVPRDAGAADAGSRRDTLAAITLAAAAAVAIRLPELFGRRLGADPDDSFYLRNLSLFVLPFLAAFFAFKRRLPHRVWYALALVFVAAALVMNLLPFTPQGSTEILAAIHLPVALWLAVGVAYAGAGWRSHGQRMNFVRFSGEWFIYYTLIALGGGILMAFTAFIFQAIGLEVEPVLARWIGPCGAAGAVIIGAWLVEYKQSVIENMAPVLTMLFTPLFTALLLVFVATMIWTGNPIKVDRDVLIGFDLLLVLVMCLLLYAISARDSHTVPGRFDRLQLLLVVSALVVDALALWAMAERISEFGFTPNRTAALGLNLLLLAHLGWSAVLYARFVANRAPFALLERWQTVYLPVYAVWAWIVAAGFPVIFHYR